MTRGQRKGVVRSPISLPGAAALLFALALVVGPQQAAAQEPSGPAVAGIMLDEAQAFLAKGKRSKATTMFRKAYRANPAGETLTKVAAGLAKADHLAEAIDIYEQYLADPQTSRRRRRHVESKLKGLRSKVGVVVLRVAPSTATLKVDGRELSLTSNPTSISLDPGKKLLFLSSNGYKSQITELEISAKQKLSVEVTLASTSEGATVAPEIVETPTMTILGPEIEASDTGNETEVSTSSAKTAATAGTDSQSSATIRQRLPWEVPTRKSGFGGLVGLHVDVESGGTAGFLAASYGVTTWIDVVAGVLVGRKRSFKRNAAAYLGARAFFTEEEVSPVASAGLISHRADTSDIGLRGGGGVAWSPYSRLWLVAELALEFYPRSNDAFKRRLYVPSLAVEGRL